MKFLRVTFAELFEVEGAFGNESISPGGAIFPKHLVLSYNLRTKTVLFPLGWKFDPTGSTFDFQFDNHIEGCLRKDMVKGFDYVEVDCDPKEFVPDKNLRLVMVDVPAEHKSYMDEIVKKYLATKMIVAERSRKSHRIRTVEGKRVTFPTHSYELIEQLVSNQNGMWTELRKEREASGEKTYMVLSEDPGVFPRQLANFKK